jgi:hypothetical protein
VQIYHSDDDNRHNAAEKKPEKANDREDAPRLDKIFWFPKHAQKKIQRSDWLRPYHWYCARRRRTGGNVEKKTKRNASLCNCLAAAQRSS